MRIISGLAKGRRLKAPPGMGVRPTSDKVRGAIFDMLQGRIEGRRVLDLFAGAGAMGIEALSRGAQEAVFIDISRDSIRCVRDNLESVGLGRLSPVLKLDLPRQLDKLVGGDTRFDLVFIDPPYGKGLAESTLEKLALIDLVNPDAIIVVEHSSRENITGSYGRLIFKRRRTWSTTAASFYERAP